jgi:hypothetical protein
MCRLHECLSAEEQHSVARIVAGLLIPFEEQAEWLLAATEEKEFEYSEDYKNRPYLCLVVDCRKRVQNAVQKRHITVLYKVIPYVTEFSTLYHVHVPAHYETQAIAWKCDTNSNRDNGLLVNYRIHKPQEVEDETP